MNQEAIKRAKEAYRIEQECIERMADYFDAEAYSRAVELLKTTELTKLEIAERCGFSGSSNFSKAFAHVTGKKPGDYQ